MRSGPKMWLYRKFPIHNPILFYIFRWSLFLRSSRMACKMPLYNGIMIGILYIGASIACIRYNLWAFVGLWIKKKRTERREHGMVDFFSLFASWEKNGTSYHPGLAGLHDDRDIHICVCVCLSNGKDELCSRHRWLLAGTPKGAREFTRKNTLFLSMRSVGWPPGSVIRNGAGHPDRGERKRAKNQ